MNETTLRSGLLTRLAPMLLVLLLLDAAACYYTALRFANIVYDQWLLDSARSLSRALAVRDGEVDFDLTTVGREVFQFDELDRTYFRITSPRRGELAGEPGLPGSAAVRNGTVTWSDGLVAGEPVRVAIISVRPRGATEDIIISVGETLRKRSRLTVQILLGMVAPQIGLLIVAAAFAWTGVSRGLKPLTDLARIIESRDVRNLQPLPEEQLPREARILAHQINELLGRLGNALQANRRFVATAAHQLRTPLAALVLHSEQAEQSTDPESRQRAQSSLRKSVDRAARLTSQLLSLARAEPDSASVPQMRAVDLVALARSVGEEAIPAALPRDIDFGLIVPDSPVPVTGNPGLLGDAVSNLVDNAIRHAGQGAKVNVIVKDGKNPEIIVEDNGRGIPQQERARVFERFYRPPGSSGDGSGLGLAIVHEIAAIHGAVVELTEGQDGRGATFTMRFPARAVKRPDITMG